MTITKLYSLAVDHDTCNYIASSKMYRALFQKCLHCMQRWAMLWLLVSEASTIGNIVRACYNIYL